VATVELSVEEFLSEIRIAPKWKLFQYYQSGFFELLVFYSFETWIYRSPAVVRMTDAERKHFYKTLSEIMIMPFIAEARVE
jgi:hypothetical protein